MADMTDSGLQELRREIDRAGYYPQLVAEAIEDALAAEPVRACCVHQETTFDADEVRRHVTVLALTPTRLVVGHADDHPADELMAAPYVTASTETVALSAVTSVVVQRVVTEPTRHRVGAPPAEITGEADGLCDERVAYGDSLGTAVRWGPSLAIGSLDRRWPA